MYACVVCGEELFSSACKYESGCGWPAFYDTEDENKLIYKADLSHGKNNRASMSVCVMLFCTHAILSRSPESQKDPDIQLFTE